jgi:5'-3' exonuclease
MRLLVDLDILLYRSLWGCKGDFQEKLLTCDYMIEKIMSKLGSTDISLFLSGSNNFRHGISNTYKANRKDQPRPEYLAEARQYYIDTRNASVTDGVEADDAIGMAHDENSIVVSSDKDFFQLGGLIYNPVSDKLYDVKNPWYFFYVQMLTGDKADNIEGIKNPDKSHYKIPPNFTDATAKKWLHNKSCDYCRTTVGGLYLIQFGDHLWFDKYDMNARLLFLKRSYATEYHEIF